MIDVIDVKWRMGVAMDYQLLIRVAGSIYDIYVDDYNVPLPHILHAAIVSECNEGKRVVLRHLFYDPLYRGSYKKCLTYL